MSRCNGSCPTINLQIDSSKNIYVNRQYFKSKSELDSTYSGSYQGKLSEKQFEVLLVLLNKVGMDSLSMDSTQICCDMQVTTLIVYYNGRKRYLKSRITTGREYDLLVLLKSFGEDKTLYKVSQRFEIEE